MKEAIHVMRDHLKIVPVSDLFYASAFQVMNMQIIFSYKYETSMFYKIVSLNKEAGTVGAPSNDLQKVKVSSLHGLEIIG